MSLYTVQPITDFGIFTTPAAERKRSQFSTSWSGTVHDLRRELRHLDGSDVVLEIAVDARHIRLDGQLRADAKPTHPGVRLSFQTREHGPMSLTCDTYMGAYGSPAWQANVRAIVLSLEKMRDLDRYGATKGAQYAGFKALGAGTGAVALGGMTLDDAWSIIGSYGEGTNREQRRVFPLGAAAAHRRARAANHPDRRDGDSTLWNQVEQAAAVLGLTS